MSSDSAAHDSAGFCPLEDWAVVAESDQSAVVNKQHG